MFIYINDIVVATERNSDYNVAVNVVFCPVKKGDIITLNTYGTSCSYYGHNDISGEKIGVYYIPFR